MSEGKQGAGDMAIGWLILAIIFGALGWLVWYFFSEQILNSIRWVRVGEMWVVAHFVGENYMIEWRGQQVPFRDIYSLAQTMPAGQIDGEFMSLITHAALAPMKWIIILITGAIGIWALFKGPGTQHRTVYNMDTLIERQSRMFPIISPFVDFNPADVPPRAPGSPVPAELPPFAEALGPEEWLAYFNIPAPDGKVDEKAAFKAFTKQLGPRWKGAKNLAPFKQVLLAACCLKASRKRNDADAMLGRLALCWTHKDGLKLSKDKTLLKEAQKVLRDRKLAELTITRCNQHAWETTALMRALATAREEGGVLAPAQFVWLRAFERSLWYPLNNMGRQSFHMEAIGAMAHYKAEKMAQRPIPVPKVGDAVQSITEYMASDRARPIPQLNYSGTKKRAIKKLKTA